jgi:hypothetical protein
MLKLAVASLVMGLLLVSLDITPKSLLAMADDAGPILQQWARNVWRIAEILLGCLLAGGLLVLPYWLLQRWRKKRKPQLIAVPANAPFAPVETAAVLSPPEPAKTMPAGQAT